MSLNIKNEETHNLARELADLTGENISEAVAKAIRERLAKVKKQPHTSRLEAMRAIAKDCASRMKEPYRSIDHGEYLYDAMGLPK